MKSVCKRFLSFFLTLSVCASTFVGALCLSVHKTSADQVDQTYLNKLQERVEADYVNSDITVFFDHAADVLEDTWYDSNIGSEMPIGIMALVDPYNSHRTCIILYKSNWINGCVFSYTQNGNIEQYWPAGNTSYQYGGIVTAYLYTDENGMEVRFNSNILIQGDSSFSFGTGTHYFIPCISNIRHASYKSYVGANDKGKIYSGSTSSYIQGNLFSSPVSAYNNMILKSGDRYYFSISDQQIIREARAGDCDFIVTFMSNDDPTTEIGYTFSSWDFTNLAFYAYPGMINVSPLGVEAYDITEILTAYRYDALVRSYVYPRSYNPDFFSDLEVAITMSPVRDAWSEYYTYMNELLDMMDVQNQVVLDDPPIYITQNVSSSYKDRLVACNYQDSGRVLFSELPSVPFDYILVCSDKMFTTFNWDLVLLSGSGNSFSRFFDANLLQQCDMIVVLPDSDFSDVVSDYQGHEDDFINYMPTAWTIGSMTGPHGLFYFTLPTIRDSQSDDRQGLCMITSRYLQKCQNYMLADGIDLLYQGFSKITENQGTIAQSILSGAATIYTTIQTVGMDSQNIPFLSKIYNLMFSWNLSDKLDNLLDKLDRIIDNTSTDEAEGGFWIEPLYLFIKLFEPSTDDYTNSISSIITTYEGLPAIPSITPVAIPTSQIYIPGG